MKLSIALILIGALQVTASVYSQNTKLNLSMDERTIKDVFREIEKQSNFHFLYNDDFVDLDRVVSISMKESKIEDILFTIFEKANITFKVLENNLVVITPVDFLKRQQQIITGRVIDADTEEPLPGVYVLIEGTNTGAITDSDGKYSLEIISSDAIVVFSYVGYNTEKVTVLGQSTINISLVPDIKRLNEVVVIGYGTTTKKEVTGSISSIGNKDFKKGNVTNPMQLLQGQVAGLNIVRPNGGDPNGDLEIQLRGLTTLAGGADPLIVVDGVIGGSLSNISPEVIESIDVLKDGSAAAIYGTRGTNGVILITTKKATPGKSTVEFSSYVAMQSVAKKLDVLSADEFRKVITDYFPAQQDAYDYGASTDWFKEVTRQHPISQYYNLSSSGGSDQFSYLANISWQDDQGLVLKSESNKLRARINVTQKGVKDRLTLNYNISYSTGKNTYSNNEILQQAARRNPTEPIYDVNNETPISGGYYYNDGPFQYYNPVAMIKERTDEGNLRNFFGSVNASFKILEELKVNTLASLTQTNDRYGHYYGRYYPVDFGTDGRAEVYNNQSKTKLLEINFDYQKSINDHKIQAIGGYSYNEGENETYSMSNYLFDTDSYSFYNIGAGSALVNGKASMSSYKESNKLIAFFGRVMYNYKEKYLLSASLRYEGSSRFGANNKWGTFPAISLGWRINEEGFMKDVTWVNNLKLRMGYGVTGNQEIGNYNSLQILSKGTNFYYNGDWISTYKPASNPNPDLKWEKKGEFNLGLDLSILKSRLSSSIDYYSRRTKDLLYTYTVPVPPNLYNKLFTNVGTVDNKGIEITINAMPVKKKDFSWNTTLIFSRNKNKLVSFSSKDYAMVDIKTGYMSTDLKVYTERIVEGGPIGNFWGPKFLGFDEDGNNIFEDINDDSNIDSDDNQVIGNAYPDFTFSLTNIFTYKNFDLSFLLRGSVGNDILNENRLYYEGFGYFGSKNILNSTLDHPEYQGAAIYSSRFIEDGSYLKLDNLTLGYNFQLINGIFSKLKAYITGQNLFTITKYKGVDPEISLVGLEPGIDWYDYYPRTRTFLVGINVAF